MKHIEWKDHTLFMLDQRRLPAEIKFMPCHTVTEVCEAIECLAVRGAPAIGIAAAYGMVLSAEHCPAESDFNQWMTFDSRRLAATRPTAVNLCWALDRMEEVWSRADREEAPVLLLQRAREIEEDDIKRCRAIGAYGSELLPQGARVLTHCHTGAIATGGYGTALGIVRSGFAAGKVSMVYADETRPLLQGARLTTWELMESGIPVTLIGDAMAAGMMQDGEVDVVIVGADRIAANGDVANKIGTYGLAVLANHHRLSFYVAAPLSTFDPSTATGADIVIEERDGDEVRKFGGQLIPPAEVPVRNPAFDVTPHQLITALVTEKGILRPDYAESIANLLK